MSYILDALNRSEQERSGHAPTLEPRAPVPTGPPVSSRPVALKLLLAVAVLLLIVGLFITYQQLSKETTEQVVVAEQVVVVAPVTTERMPPAETIKVEQVDQVATTNVAPEASSQHLVVEPENTPLLAPQPAVAAISEGVSSPEPTPVVSAVEALYQDGRASSEAAPLEAEVSALYRQHEEALAQPVQSDQAAEPESALSAEQIDRLLREAQPKAKVDLRKLPPTIEQLSLRQQEAIPAIEYSAHIYSSRADKGFVILNGQKRYRGDSISAGFKLLEIFPNSILLDYQGTEFRLPAMQSWQG
ncbi:type II secretion system (T2SS) protein B [Sinobacterium caligoides]|uniref:Type II secretion system (T2SS) protein B n=1 Tax=Sinobacterium caligoides TaxID=933926 RepID=A0A3N2E2G2_9GAMM|nr:general secretion pathway protein GspB [Sinobacterium caligoides]ROS05765.1 type II secretion system (T2SS) protein B [Sinobacterium caligoides]